MLSSFYLLLGCLGEDSDSFVSCLGVENPILFLNKESDYYESIIAQLSFYEIFKRPISDYNQVRSLISRCYSKLYPEIWTEALYKKYLDFTVQHKNCQIYLCLSTTDNSCSYKYFKNKAIAVPTLVKSCNPLLSFKISKIK